VSRNSFDIIFENDDFRGVNKPSGLLSIPASDGKETSLKELLSTRYRPIFTVHRLDHGTSGAILFAKNETTHQYLSQEFESRKVVKKYVGIIHGSLSQKKGSIDVPLAKHPSRRTITLADKRGKPSLTDYEVVEEFGSYSFIRFQIHAGRTHQIRVHMQYVGHPIVCDELYGNAGPVLLSSFKKKFKLSRSDEEEKPIFSRLALHAELVNFNDANGNPYTIEAPLPKDMKAFLQQLRKWNKR
jgi:23S rRNA pseudouridine955/2504/2580 synthase/23S rRNA pseudouridine1911/1915/1917 synthase